jgi:hypothetical protein
VGGKSTQLPGGSAPPRRRSPIARWAFHPEIIQAGAGLLLCAIALLLPSLGTPQLSFMQTSLTNRIGAGMVVGPLLLLRTRNYRPIGSAALMYPIVGLFMSTVAVVLFGFH